MFKKNLSIFILLIVFLLSASVDRAFAVTTPTFPLCANPQGQVIASYPNGIHGVPGDSTTYTGSDTVYSLSEDTLMQCLCVNNGNGIQTNWWKLSELSQDQINILINQGWILVPDGSAWGLSSGSYLAQNSNFSCGGGGTGGGDGLSDGLSDGRSDGRGGSTLGSVLGISTQAVLGLASTGNTIFILSVFILGFALMGSGIFFSLRKRQ